MDRDTDTEHLVDSSLDWSQDAKELKRWFDSHPADVLPPQRVYLSFFGGTPLEYFGIQAIKLPSFVSPWQPNVEESLHGGTYCISATELQNVLLPPYAGRWNNRYEEAYQLLRHNVELYRRSHIRPRRCSAKRNNIATSRRMEQNVQAVCTSFASAAFAVSCGSANPTMKSDIPS